MHLSSMRALPPIQSAGRMHPLRGKKMLKTAFILHLIALIGILSAALAQTPAASIRPAAGMKGSPQDGSIELSGEVVDEQTGSPVTDFAVEWGESRDLDSEIAWGYGLKVRLTQRRDGQFHESRPFRAGRKYSMRILAPGYQPQPVTGPLTMAVRISNLIVRLKRGIEIRGIVTDHAGNAVISAHVYLTDNHSMSLRNGSSELFKGSTASTDSDGRFVLTGSDESSPQHVLVTSGGTGD